MNEMTNEKVRIQIYSLFEEIIRLPDNYGGKPLIELIGESWLDKIRFAILFGYYIKDKNISSTKNDWGNIKYQCGHEACAVVLDSNELSISAYLNWKDTVGFEGDKSQCWSCYCRSSTEKEKGK